MPYRCRDCRKYFSVKTGTVMAGSPLSLRKWAFAIYLDATSVKGLSSMRLAEYISVTQKTPWFMQQRIREAFADQRPELFFGPVGLHRDPASRKTADVAATGGWALDSPHHVAAAYPRRDQS
ncbi:MAG: hypothetical protein OXN97_15950 [Bryobacterales bacterium]|nr:hypothetical protein [Bryobacterales bacterium]